MSSFILSDNFFNPDRVAGVTASSEKALFPLSNISSDTRRSKIWRSNGYFRLFTDQTITFFETSLTPLTATLPKGEWSTFELFAASLKSALEAAGSSTYAVTRDSTTSKIRVASNFAGGGGVFEIDFTTPESAELRVMMGFAEVKYIGAAGYTADFLRIHSSEWLKIDMGISTNPESFVLAGPRNSPLTYSGDATITLQGNETDVFTDPSFTAEIKTGPGNVFSLSKDASSEGLHTEALRFWRILFEDKQNPNGFIEAGVVFLGHILQMDRGKVQIPFSASYLDTSVTVYSESGQSFSDPRPVSETFSVEMFGLTVDDKERFDFFFEEFGTRRPFFMQFDSKAVIGSDPSQYLRYVKMTSAPSWSVPFPGVFVVSFALREEL